MINYANNDVIVAPDGKWLYFGPDPYNPLDLPPGVIRVRTSDGNPPPKSSFNPYESATLVEGTNDVYDIYLSGTNFKSVLSNNTNVVECLGANTSHVTDMGNLFYRALNLASTAIFDTRNVTNTQGMFGDTAISEIPRFDLSNVVHAQTMFAGCTSLVRSPIFDTPLLEEANGMFYGCTSLVEVPQLVTPNITNVMTMFGNCPKVESGALSMYQYFASFGGQITNHYQAFYMCGQDTVTGSAELAQIPSGWK